MQLSPDPEFGNGLGGRALLLDHKTVSDLGPIQKLVMILNNSSRALRSCTGAVSFECLPYQLSIVSYTLTMAVTGNGESGFDSGEGA